LRLPGANNHAIQIDAGFDADLMAKEHKIFRADVPRRSGLPAKGLLHGRQPLQFPKSQGFVVRI
jgi:hypothetical protein